MRKKHLFEDIISTIETSFPRDLFYVDFATTPEQMEDKGLTEEQIYALLSVFIPRITDTGLDANEIDRILSTDPFSSNRDATMNVLKERGFLNE